MTTSTKTSRLDFRVTENQKATIERAASILGRTTSDFSLDVLVRQAEEVIRQEQQLLMNAADFDKFVAIMDEPAKPIAELANLLTRKSVFID